MPIPNSPARPPSGGDGAGSVTRSSTSTTPPLPFDVSAIRAAIIDLDGTMLDTADDFTAALNGVLSALTLPPIDRDEVVRYIGKGSERLIRDVLHSRLPAERAEAAFSRACDDYQHEYAKINGHHAMLYPGVVEGVIALYDLGLKLACVTNKPERFARALLERHGLSPYFLAVYGGDSVSRKKPDPLPMLAACQALGVKPAQTVAIGDSENDVIAARAAGIASLTVPYGYNHGKPVQTLGTDAIVATLLDAAHLLEPARAGNGTE